MKSWHHSKSSLVSAVAKMTPSVRMEFTETGGFLQLPSKEEEETNIDLEAMNGSTAPVLLPSYWRADVSDQDFNSMELLVDSKDEMQMQLQRLLDDCFEAKATRDRCGSMPQRLVVELVQRLEHHALWKRYVEKRRRVQLQRHNSVTPISAMPGSGDCKTTKALGGLVHSRLNADLNELYLFHGSNPAGVLGIGQHGFDLKMSGDATGCMFGPGAYFAESSSKCDEYAKEDPSGLFSGKCALLLCRVVCGELFRTEESDVSTLRTALATGEFDGVLGDRETAVGTYREFVVYDDAQVYPEYIIIYRREFD